MKGWAKWVKKRERYKPPVMEQVSHRNEKQSIRNTVNGTVSSDVMGTGGSYTCEHSMTYRVVTPLQCTTETNVTCQLHTYTHTHTHTHTRMTKARR